MPVSISRAVLIVVLLMAGGAWRLPGNAQVVTEAERLLQKAILLETVDGNLQAAIEQYRKIVAENGSNRGVAARALLQLAGCYEKLGEAQARGTYERLIASYPEQTSEVAAARSRLAALKAAPGEASAPPTLRLVWSGTDVDTTGSPSPDGRLLAVTDVATSDVAVRDLTTGKVRRLTRSGAAGEHAYVATFSPDGRRVAYGWFDSKTRVYDARVIGVDGTNARTLYHDNAGYVFPMAWTGDGAHVAVIADNWGTGERVKQIGLVSVADGTLRVLKTVAVDGLHDRISASPDGRYLVYHVPQRDGRKDIFLVSVRDGRETLLVGGDANDAMPIWAPGGGRVLFMSDRTGSSGLWMLEVVDGRAASPPELLKRDIGAGFVPMGFTRTGALYYGIDTGMVDVHVAAIDPDTGRVVEAPAPVGLQGVGANRAPRWSPDGKYLAYLSGRGPAAGTIVTVRTLETGKERDVPVNVAGITRLAWLPGAAAVLFAGIDSQQQPGIYRLDLQSGALSPVVRREPEISFGLVSVTRDGRTLVYMASTIQTRTRTIVVRDLQTEQERTVTSSLSPSGLAVSPDGLRLAIWTVDPATRRTAILVMPVSGGEPREVCRLERPEVITGQPAWTPDGRSLLFPARLQDKTVLMSVFSDGGKPRSFAITMEGLGEASIHPDGKRIAFAAGQAKSEVWAIESFLPAAKEAPAAVAKK